MERCGDGNNGGEEGRWQLVGVRLLLAGGWEFEIDFDQQSGPEVDFFFFFLFLRNERKNGE